MNATRSRTLIRRATVADAVPLAAISIEVWIGTYLRDGVRAEFAQFALDTFTPDALAALIDDPAQVLFVSENSDGPDGYIRVARDADPPVPFDCPRPLAEVATLYVQPRHQGKGIGSALLAAACATCRTQGIAGLWLTTNSQNAPAIGYYRATGWHDLGQTMFHIGDGAYLNHVFGLVL